MRPLASSFSSIDLASIKNSKGEIMSQEQIIHDVTPKLDDSIDDSDDEFYEKISIDSLGAALNSSTEGGSKPEFTKNTAATVMSVNLKKSKKVASTKDGRPYIPLIVTIECQTDDGQTTYDNYGGLRETEEGGLWCGEKSQFGKLIKLIKEEDDDISTYNDIFKFLQAPGLRVKIKTQSILYNGQEYKKNLITQFI